MNPTIKAVLALLKVMWEAADREADAILAQDGFDQDESLKALIKTLARMETIQDVTEAVKHMAGEQANDR